MRRVFAPSRGTAVASSRASSSALTVPREFHRYTWCDPGHRKIRDERDAEGMKIKTPFRRLEWNPSESQVFLELRDARHHSIVVSRSWPGAITAARRVSGA